MPHAGELAFRSANEPLQDALEMLKQLRRSGGKSLSTKDAALLSRNPGLSAAIAQGFNANPEIPLQMLLDHRAYQDVVAVLKKAGWRNASVAPTPAIRIAHRVATYMSIESVRSPRWNFLAAGMLQILRGDAEEIVASAQDPDFDVDVVSIVGEIDRSDRFNRAITKPPLKEVVAALRERQVEIFRENDISIEERAPGAFHSDSYVSDAYVFGR